LSTLIRAASGKKLAFPIKLLKKFDKLQDTGSSSGRLKIR
jgi:hypothetical protein